MRIGLRDKRYRMPAEKRKFGGVVYTYLILSGYKKETETYADSLRKKGMKVRIVPWGGSYAVYIHESRKGR